VVRVTGDLNVVHAAQLAQVHDDGAARRGVSQSEMHLIEDGAVAIRDGVIVAVGRTSDVLAEWEASSVCTLDATGRTVMPGLVECHSHPIFAGERHAEYAERLGGASLAEVAARGGGIWSSVVATRSASDDVLLGRLAQAYERIAAGGVTTLEVKSGYGLTVDTELQQLAVLEASRALTAMELVITFLGAHVVPRDLTGDADLYTDLIATEMLPAHSPVPGCHGRGRSVHADPGAAADGRESRRRSARAGPRRCLEDVARLADRSGGWRRLR
jgi:imidazolonepropionase